jgi:hypothetical protein
VEEQADYSTANWQKNVDTSRCGYQVANNGMEAKESRGATNLAEDGMRTASIIATTTMLKTVMESATCNLALTSPEPLWRRRACIPVARSTLAGATARLADTPTLQDDATTILAMSKGTEFRRRCNLALTSPKPHRCGRA